MDARHHLEQIAVWTARADLTPHNPPGIRPLIEAITGTLTNLTARLEQLEKGVD